MRRSGGAVVLVVIGLACSPIKTAHAPADAPATTAGAQAARGSEATWIDVTNAEVAQIGAGRRLTLALTRTPEVVRDQERGSPPRLVLDLDGPRPAEPRQVTAFPLSDELVSRVRVGSFGGKLRAIVDLSHAPGPHAVRSEGAKVIVDLGDTSLAAAAPARAARKRPGALGAAATPAVAKPAVLTRFPLTDDMVAGVRVATNGGALRIVADLNHPALTYTVHREGNRLVADLGDTGTAENAPAAHLMLVAEFENDAAAAEAEFDGETAPPPPAAEPPARVAAAEPEAKQPPPPAAEPEPAATPEPAPPAHVASLPHAPPPAQPVRREGIFTGQRISLDFKDADIQNVLRVLADVSGLNIIATDDVKGKVTLHLNDVPWDQALDLVLRSNRLAKTQEGNVVRISTVSRLQEEREALRAAQDAERELEPLRVKYIRVNYAKADETLIEKVKGVLTDRGSVTFDDRTNTIIVRDIPHGTDDAAQLIHELDVQSPQVLIEANIVDATRDMARALGVQLGYNCQARPSTGNPTGLNFPGTVGVGGSGLNDGPAPVGANGAARSPVPFLFDFPVGNGFSGFGPGNGSSLDVVLGSLDGVHALAARLTALEQQGKAKVISRPRVITLNNVAATIQSLT